MKKILYIPNEPLEIYYEFKQTYNMYPFKYFDPVHYFDKIYFSYLSPTLSGHETKGKFFINRVKRTNVFKSKLLNYFNIFDYIKFIVSTVKLVRNEDIDIIRAYNNHVEGFLATVVGKLTHKPVVVSVHNDFFYERKHTKKSDIASYLIINNIQRILEFFTNRSATNIFCVSTHLRKQIIAYNKIIPSKIKVTYNKVELDKFKKNKKSEQEMLIKKYNLKNKKAFLFLGRFVWQKNIFTLLRAFENVVTYEKDAVLVMVSDGPLKKDVEKHIKENDLSENVRMLGFVSNDTLPSLFRICKAFVLPSYYEGFGIALIEAQASGCPVIVSDIPSVRDIVNEKNSWLINPMKDESISKMMEFFFDSKNASVINKKAAQASKDVKRFAWSTLAEREISYYKELL